MTPHEKIAALRAKADSTQFEGEARVFRAKADELESKYGAAPVTDDSEYAPGVRMGTPNPGVYYSPYTYTPGVPVDLYGSTGVYGDTFYGGGGGL